MRKQIAHPRWQLLHDRISISLSIYIYLCIYIYMYIYIYIFIDRRCKLGNATSKLSMETVDLSKVAFEISGHDIRDPW